MSNIVKVIKTCKKCQVEKTLDNFRHKKRTKDGYSIYCRECASEMDKISYQKHIEKRKAYSKKYSRKNSQKIRIRVREWQKNNKDKTNENRRNWYKRNKQKASESFKEKYYNNLEFRVKCLEAKKLWKKENREIVSAYNKAYSQRPGIKEKQRLNQKKWLEKNRIEINRKRRERIANNKEKYLNSIRYAKGYLVKNSNLKFADIPEELAKVYILKLQLSRLKREVKNGKKSI